MDINEHELDDIDDFSEDGDLLLNSDLDNEESQVNHFGDYQHKDRQNLFGANQDDDDDDDNDDPNVDDDDKQRLNNSIERDQATQGHINNVSDNISIFMNSSDNQDSTHSESNHGETQILSHRKNVSLLHSRNAKIIERRTFGLVIYQRKCKKMEQIQQNTTLGNLGTPRTENQLIMSKFLIG